MKKILSLTIILIALIVVIISCKKNMNDPEYPQPSTQISQGNQGIEQNIISFKDKIESKLKGGSDYTIDSAVWYTEALVNYTYASIVNNFQGLSFDSVFIDVSLTDGKVTLAEAASVYYDIIDSLTEQYENLPAQNLHLVFADVFSRDSTAGSVTFGVFSSFAYGSPITIGGSFGEDDWWTFGWSQYNNGGYCDGPHEGEDKDWDAAKKIEQRLRYLLSVSSPRYTLTSVSTFLILPWGDVIDQGTGQFYYCDFENPEDETEWDNYYDYLMFYNYSAWDNFHFCLSPDEMNFYLAGTYTVFWDEIYECVGEVLEDKDLASFTIVGDNNYTYPNYWYLHYSTNTYGIWVENQNQPASFE